MKGGRIPIHIMRWAPADYVNDPAVKLALAKRDLVASTFYPLFLFHAFMEGGSLPSDPVLLAAIVGMRPADVRKAVAFFVGHGKLREVDGRLSHERVVREVKAELEFRELQSERGKLGGRPKRESGGLATEKPPVVESESPPCAVRRAPAPTPAPTPVVPPAAPDGHPSPPVLVAWSREACDAWIGRFGGTAPGGQIGKALKPLVDRHGWSEVATAWRSYLTQTDAEYASPQRFAATYGRWSGTAPPGTAHESSADVLRAAVMGGLKGK